MKISGRALAHAADLIDPAGGDGLWVPFDKQQLATDLAGQADELLFGGAAGPGKTEWLMEYGISQMEKWAGNRGLILRRVFPSLNRSIIPRLKAKLAAKARWNANEKTFTFDNGSVLEVSSLQYLDDVYDYQGAEYGWLGWEELTEFNEEQYEYLLGRLRAPTDGVRPHSCATTNPGGRGHRWVKRRFVKPRIEDLPEGSPVPMPMTVWRPRGIPGRHDESNPPLSRCYVPATHRDNPKLLERDPTYISRLRAQSDRGKRKAYEEGDWDAIDEVEGALWSQQDLDTGRWSPAHLKQESPITRVVAVDPSEGNDSGDEYGVAVVGRTGSGVGIVEKSLAWKMPVRLMARQTVELAREVGAEAIVVERNHGGKWMVEVFRGVDEYANIQTVWASDGKLTRARPVAALFAHDPDHRLPYRARLIGFHEELEEELTTHAFEPGDPSPDRIDAMVWGLTYLMLGRPITRSRNRPRRDARLRGRR